MEKQELLYEGKAKKIYGTNEENVLWIEYKNEATAFNGEKKAEIEGKAVLNNKISSLIFAELHKANIETHFIKQLSNYEQLVRQVTIIPIEVVVRNIAAGSISKRLGFEEGMKFEKTLVEFYYKDDSLGDPLITDDHALMLELATKEELEEIKQKALAVNEVLIPYFKEKNITLVDFKLEFGKTVAGQIILADEISPDTCRFWDSKTNQKLDKDVFRRDLGKLTDAYNEILTRIGG
ncbi:phosphoribosylaminoimidazole-succinocarboxamide synthase [Bacillus fengqiuensis]|nr:phosphoribosylaminoimidazole-succinocarboxamide synthase [Bacillus fengqiuensis]